MHLIWAYRKCGPLPYFVCASVTWDKLRKWDFLWRYSLPQITQQIIYIMTLESNYSVQWMGRMGAPTATVAAGHNPQFLFRRAERTELVPHLKNGFVQLICLSAKLHFVMKCFLLIVLPNLYPSHGSQHAFPCSFAFSFDAWIKAKQTVVLHCSGVHRWSGRVQKSCPNASKSCRNELAVIKPYKAKTGYLIYQHAVQFQQAAGHIPLPCLSSKKQIMIPGTVHTFTTLFWRSQIRPLNDVDNHKWIK